MFERYNGIYEWVINYLICISKLNLWNYIYYLKYSRKRLKLKCCV